MKITLQEEFRNLGATPATRWAAVKKIFFRERATFIERWNSAVKITLEEAGGQEIQEEWISCDPFLLKLVTAVGSSYCGFTPTQGNPRYASDLLMRKRASWDNSVASQHWNGLAIDWFTAAETLASASVEQIASHLAMVYPE